MFRVRVGFMVRVRDRDRDRDRVAQLLVVAPLFPHRDYHSIGQ